MDKIDISTYFDYTIEDHTLVDQTTWCVNELILLIAPSPQLINFLTSKGWHPSSYVLTDPTAITDYCWMQKSQYHDYAVIGAMLEEFNTLYNEGRELNNDRFDDLVAVWTSTLDKTEDGLNSIEDDEDTFEALVEAVIGNLATEYTTHETDVSGDLDDWGDSERNRIDDAFDAKEDELQQSMVDRGIYNTTTWDSISAGLTREESDADTELEDKITQRQLELSERLYDKQVDIRMKFLEARHRLIDVLHKQGSARIEMRNRVIEAINGLVERRTDEYPSFLEPVNAALSVAVGQRSQGWS